MPLFRRFALPFWSILIALVLWIQVHGQGMGSLRMDVALQVRDVPADMVIVNDLPDQVSITISGLQSQLNALDAENLFVSVDASALNMPGVIDQALDVEAIDLPSGLKVEKIQPDSVQLQVDHVVNRTIEITPVFDLPQGWKAEHVVITPATADLSGPEVWLSTLNKIETTALRLDLAQGIFDVETEIAPLSGKGIHVLNKDLKIRVRGELVWTPTVEKASPEIVTDKTSDDYGKAVESVEQVSIVPKPVPRVAAPAASLVPVNDEPIAVERLESKATEVKPVPIEAEPAEVAPTPAAGEPIPDSVVVQPTQEPTSLAPVSDEVYSQPQDKPAPTGDL